MTRKYDYVIIGGGAAGFSSIVKLNELTDGKASILLISRGLLGGTCVNTGCVPSKTLIEIAKHYKHLNRFRDRGLSITNAELDFNRVFQAIRKLVSELRGVKYESILKEFENVDFIKGHAEFISPNKVKIKGEEELLVEANKFLIATGSRPFIPNIKGINEVDYYTTDNLWELDYKPEEITIVGSGAIGLEISQALARLGVKVNVIEVLDRPIPTTEPEISKMLVDIISRDGVKFYFKSRVSSVSKKGDRIQVNIVTQHGDLTLESDALLLATGRMPNSDKLGLDKAGVEINDRGYIKVDETLKSSNPNIYAAGDVAGTPKPALLETIAAREGVNAAYGMTGNEVPPLNYNIIPVVVFTDPELAYVGMSEKMVVEELGACACRGVLFKLMPKSAILNIEDGYAKVVVDPYTGVIKGVHVLSPYASEFIIQASLYMRHGYKVNDILDVIQVFPTASEIVKAAGQAFIRRIDKMPCCVE